MPDPPIAGEPLWATETLYPTWRTMMRIDSVLYEGRTELQSVCLFENAVFGKVLMLDGVCQTTTADEYYYHEMLTHVPILAHGEARRVLIVGGGDGGILRETLRHPSIERAVMVEIDGQVVDLCREYMPELSAGAFDDPRAELVIGDGAKYVADSDETFDVVIVDSTDPFGPGMVLFQPPFYTDCRSRLSPEGILVTQNGVPFLQREEFKQTARTLPQVFSRCGFYLVPVPLYVGGFMSLAFGTMGERMGPLGDRNRPAAAAFASGTQYYNPAVHDACFALPNDLLAWRQEA